MLSDSGLRELLGYSAPDTVVSLYLNTVPAEGNADAYRLRLRTMLKNVPSPADVAAIEKYFTSEYSWKGRSVAVFSCAAQGFFRAFPLAVSIPDQIYMGHQPVVKPLADVLDAFGGYGVVLVDKQGARLFFFHLGELREQEGVMGEEVRHAKHGGASAMPGRRGGTSGQTHYEDEVVEHNMKESVEFATHFFDKNHVRRILIGGSEDNIAQFRGLLPKNWQSLVVGTFAMPMTASHAEVLARAMQIGKEAEQRREGQLINQVITAAAKGSGGVLGLEDTLSAIHDNRVQTLLVDEGYAEPGLRCTGCGVLLVTPGETCLFCGSPLERIPDAVELAVRIVMANGGTVDIVRPGTAFASAGKIGALLRY